MAVMGEPHTAASGDSALVSPSPIVASRKAAAKKRGVRKHRALDDTVSSQSTLREAKKRVVKSLKAVQAKQRAETSKHHRLVAKAAKLDMHTFMRVVAMKVEMPDIICRHCHCSLKTGPALRQAFSDVQNGRSLQIEQAGNPLMTMSSPSEPPTPQGILAAFDDSGILVKPPPPELCT